MTELLAGLVLAVIVVLVLRRRRQLREATATRATAEVAPSSVTSPLDACYSRDPFTGARDRMEF